jgi:zinc protease
LTRRRWKPSCARPSRPAAVKAAPARHDVFAGSQARRLFIDKEDVNQSNIEIVGLGTDRHNPDVPALAVMNEILGGGFASRLFQKVRTELGLAYAVGGGYGFAWDHPATFRAMVLTKSASTVDATKAALAEIDGLTTGPFTEEELARAKDNILNSFLFRYDTGRRCWPSGCGWSSTAIRPTTWRPTRPRWKR